MSRLLAPAAMAVCLFVFQTTLLASLQLDLLTPVLVYVALESSFPAALLFALFFGFVADVMTSPVAGVNIALNLGVLLATWLVRGHILLASLVVRAGVAALGLATRSLLFMALNALYQGSSPTGSLALAAALQVVAGALISLPLFATLDRALELLALRQEPL